MRKNFLVALRQMKMYPRARLWMGGDFLQRLLELIGLESERAGLALVDDMPRGIDKVQPIWPCRVGGLRRVSEFIEHGGNLDPQLAYAGSGDIFAFLLVARAGEHHLVFDVALHLPDVARVRLCDVNHQKADAVAVLVVELVESGNLPPERRSSVAAEDQGDWFSLSREGRKLDLACFVELGQREIRSRVANT
jgi:hypothetical protein